MRIYEKDELEDLILALQPNSASHLFPRTFAWAKSIDLSPISLQLFDRIVQTIQYCEGHIDPSSPELSLRTKATNSGAFHKDRSEYIKDIHNSRRYFFKLKFTPNEEILSWIDKGRFLVYYPDMDLADGAAALESKGFFNDHNVPPWDTWIDYFQDPSLGHYQNYLICWVPEKFVELADKGIQVNPEECIDWVDKSDLLFNAIWNDFSYELQKYFEATKTLSTEE